MFTGREDSMHTVMGSFYGDRRNNTIEGDVGDKIRERYQIRSTTVMERVYMWDSGTPLKKKWYGMCWTRLVMPI